MKLLRVLQEREFERVGDTQTVKVDVRVIAATNVDLQEEVAKDTFREDLFYRLNVVSVYLPPLRNRREDIPRLIDYFLDKYNVVNERRLRRISRDMLNVLLRYPWPGNVRELENAIERAVVLSNDEDFTEDLLPLSVQHVRRPAADNQASESIETLTKRLAEQAIADYELREGEIYQLVIDQIEKALIDVARAMNTEFGRKRKINQSTCNQDYSCLDGFCPSFITLEGAENAHREAMPGADRRLHAAAGVRGAAGREEHRLHRRGRHGRDHGGLDPGHGRPRGRPRRPRWWT